MLISLIAAGDAANSISNGAAAGHNTDGFDGMIFAPTLYELRLIVLISFGLQPND